MNIRKKFGKIVCLLMTISMILGMTGCATLVKIPQTDTTRENPKEEQPEVTIGYKEETEEVADATGKHVGSTSAETEEVADTTSENKDTAEEPEKVGPTLSEEALMSDYFLQKLDLLSQVINEYYMNEAMVEDLRTGIYKGLFEGLGDPYSCYYTEEEYLELMESSSGVYCGIGALVQQNAKTMIITIVKPFVDGPSYKAGMLPGDIIYMVDDIDITGMDINNVVAKMKGEEGTKVKVTVVRDGENQPIDLMITRDWVEVETIESEMLDESLTKGHKLGLITITEFDEVTIQQFKDSVDRLKKEGMEGLVIDLRDNPGGLLNAVVEMLDYLLPKGLIVYTEDKYGERVEYRGTDANMLDIPMTVLINGNSASASEIFAAAMQDYKMATIVGTTSFGKGIVQSIIPLTDGTAMKLTVSRYFTPNGVCIHEKGVEPNVVVELDEKLLQQVVIEQKDDNQLAAAIAVLLEEIK